MMLGWFLNTIQIIHSTDINGAAQGYFAKL